MAVLNVESYIEAAIQSILDQTYKDFEFIVIDDGSSDCTWAIVSKYAEIDPRLIGMRNERNLGTSAALNKGLRLARGEYVTRQDGDDISLPERLTKQVDFLTAHPEVGAIGTAIFIMDDSDEVTHSQVLPTTNDKIQRILLDRMCFCGPTLMVKQKYLQEIHFQFDKNLSYSEDYDLCLRLAEVTQLANLDEPLYRYRQHSQSVSYKKRHQQMLRKAIALELAVHRRYGVRPTPEQLSNVARDYLRAAILAFEPNQRTEAQDNLVHALSISPSLLNSSELVETWVEKYTPRHSIDEAIEFTSSIFSQLFPHSRHLTRVKCRLLSKLHMQGVFTGLRSGQIELVDGHLWQGIRNDPSWLLNRGILSQVARRLGRSRWA